MHLIGIKTYRLYMKMTLHGQVQYLIGFNIVSKVYHSNISTKNESIYYIGSGSAVVPTSYIGQSKVMTNTTIPELCLLTEN